MSSPLAQQGMNMSLLSVQLVLGSCSAYCGRLGYTVAGYNIEMLLQCSPPNSNPL